MPPRPPTWPQDLPSWLQDPPKLAPRPPTWPPRPPKLASRSSNLASKIPTLAPKSSTFGPSSANLAPRPSNLKWQASTEKRRSAACGSFWCLVVLRLVGLFVLLVLALRLWLCLFCWCLCLSSLLSLLLLWGFFDMWEALGDPLGSLGGSWTYFGRPTFLKKTKVADVVLAVFAVDLVPGFWWIASGCAVLFSESSARRL